jgi:hypothetical protein
VMSDEALPFLGDQLAKVVADYFDRSEFLATGGTK